MLCIIGKKDTIGGGQCSVPKDAGHIAFSVLAVVFHVLRQSKVEANAANMIWCQSTLILNAKSCGEATLKNGNVLAITRCF